MTFLIIISISGEKLSAPRKLVTMMMFSFEVISEYKSLYFPIFPLSGGHSGDRSPRPPGHRGQGVPGGGHQVT